MRHDEPIANAFHDLYYGDLDRTWRNTFYKGHGILKCPLDLWLYHEIIWETKPDVIVECGTAHGGSALWLHDQMALYSASPDVLTVDIEDREPYYPTRPVEFGIHYLHGSSVDRKIVGKVYEHVDDRSALVILDSAHTKSHVLGELDAYASLVPVGGYLIVEDGNVHGHPVLPKHEPGPYEAVEKWLPGHPEFVIDESKHKFFMTFNPNGYLKRTRA